MQQATEIGLRLMDRLEAFARFTDEPGRLTRLYLSPAHKAAAGQLVTWMEKAGLTANLDAIGNVVGRYEGTTPDAPALLLGSHIDTIRDAGKYDGNLGVLGALAAVEDLARRGERFPFAIEVVAFGDEEGVRFPTTLAGSKALAGRFDPSTLAGRDGDGVTLSDALARFGCDVTGIAGLARDPARTLGFVEVHIEQGPVLEAEDLPVGIVTAINGASRFIVDVTGEAGHAGTVPMALRRDALTAAAEMSLAVEALGRVTKDLVATVGRFAPTPDAVNVIPGSVRFTVDIRAPDDAVRSEAIATMERTFANVAERRKVGLSVQRTYDVPATPCHARIIDQLSAAVAAAGLPTRLLSSGAGHDTMVLASLCPVGMLFVRCRGGISHNPAESITAADAGLAVDVLLRFIRAFEVPARS
jgi:allantoate deiminase